MALDYFSPESPKTNAVVYGAAGRIGLPFSVWLSGKFDNVVGIDINETEVNKLNSGQYVPFKEHGLKEQLSQAVKSGRLEFLSPKMPEKKDGPILENPRLQSIVENTDAVFIVVGTPLMPNGHLDHGSILEIANELKKYKMKTPWLLVIRSTVEIGTTDYIKSLWPNDEFNNPPIVVFWPERVMEGNALNEFDNLPSIVGLSNGTNYNDIIKWKSVFYGRNNKEDLFIVSAKEAEFMKLATNTARMMHFAIANKLYFLARENDIEFDDVFTKMKWRYPRLEFISYPGPVGGPCLSKDWAAFGSNDSYLKNIVSVNTTKWYEMIFNELTQTPLPKQVLIVGGSFKTESDNLRDSNAIELKNFLTKKIPHGLITLDVYDPVVNPDNIILNNEIGKYDAFVIMTPHKEIVDNFLNRILAYKNSEALVINPYAIYLQQEMESYYTSSLDKKYRQRIFK